MGGIHVSVARFAIMRCPPAHRDFAVARACRAMLSVLPWLVASVVTAQEGQLQSLRDDVRAERGNVRAAGRFPSARQ